MKTPGELKKETNELFRASRERRLKSKNALKSMILDLYDTLDRGEAVPSEGEPAPRHPPSLKVLP